MLKITVFIASLVGVAVEKGCAYWVSGAVFVGVVIVAEQEVGALQSLGSTRSDFQMNVYILCPGQGTVL